MLKINTKKGKFDISFAEEKPFQHESKPQLKFGNKPPRGSTSRASVNRSKQSKPPEKRPAAVRQLNGKCSSDVKLANCKSSTKDPERTAALSQKEKAKSSTMTSSSQLEIQQSKPQGDAGYITQSELKKILLAVDHSRLDNQETNANLTKVLLSALKKDQELTHKQTVNSHDESHQVPVKNQLDQANVSHLPQARHSVGQPQDNHLDKTAQWKSELDAQVAERNRKKAEDLSKGHDKLEEYNPWGRPGAGAPMRTQSGEIVADYRTRRIHGLGSNVESPNAADTDPHQPAPYLASQQPRPEAVMTAGSSTSYSSTSVPAAMRSSFAIGAPGLVSQDAAQRKADEHKKYLHELNLQIQEKKERERQEKLRTQQEDQRNSTWAQHLDQYKAPPKPSVITAPSAVATQPQATPVAPGLNVISQPQATPVAPGLNGSNSSVMFGVGNVTGNASVTPRTHARGHGMHTLDLQSQEEAERKRQKMLEHQRAIQEQVEEKRRIKQQKKEQRMREEAVEEAKLARERERIQQQHEMDQRKQREKEEEAKRRSEALRLSVLQAYEEAQQAKNDKRLKHLEAAGHDVSMLKSRSNGATSRSYVIDARGAHLESEQMSKEPAQTRRSATPREERKWASQTGNFDLPSEYNALIGKETEMKHSSSYDDHSSFKIENSRPVVPPLDLERGYSPPIPTVRNRMRAKSPKRSSREKRGKMSRTGSSLSEPSLSQRRKSPTPRSQRNKLKSKVGYTVISTPRESKSSERPEVEDKLPVVTIEDAFMVPYLRTTSATLPPPPDTPAATQALANNKSRGKVDTRRTTQNERTRGPHRGENLPSLNRPRTISLKEDLLQEKSPRNTKRTQETQKSYVKSRQTYKENSRSSKGQEQHKGTHKDHRSVGETSRSHSTMREDSPDFHVPILPSARQEMILKQLAALRQDLQHIDQLPAEQIAIVRTHRRLRFM